MVAALNPDDIVQEALVLRGWGLSVLPVRRKKPLGAWKHFQNRRPSEREVERLFRRADVDGIGVVCGPVSGGLVCRDFDVADSYSRWRDGNPDLAAALPTVRTGRGYHTYFRSAAPVYSKLTDGELIGDGKHITVLPPSQHPNGNLYEWLSIPLGPSEFPLLDPKDAGFLPDSPTFKPLSWGHKSCCVCWGVEGADLPGEIREAALRTQPTRVGERNGCVYQFARALRDLVPEDAGPGLLYGAVQAWWGRAKHVVGTQEFGVTVSDFRRAWATVCVPLSQSRPMQALRRGAEGGDDARERLLGACRALAAETGGEFYLSVRTAAKAGGISKSYAGRLLADLVSEGTLVVTRKGTPHAAGRRGTTWYGVAAGGGG